MQDEPDHDFGSSGRELWASLRQTSDSGLRGPHGIETAARRSDPRKRLGGTHLAPPTSLAVTV